MRTLSTYRPHQILSRAVASRVCATLSTQSTYSEILQIPGDWNLAGNKRHDKRVAKKQRQRQERNQEPQAGKRCLKGCVPERSTQLYLEHIQMHIDDTDDDIAKMVKAHGQSNGVRVMSAYVIHNRVCSDVVGCKITVPVSHEETALSPNFWAEDISCRPWENRGPRGRQRQQQKQQPQRQQQIQYRERYGEGPSQMEHW